jgi:hypothetical protein
LNIPKEEAFGKPWRKQENNIKKNLIIKYKDKNWTEMAKNTDNCQAIINMAVKLQVHEKYKTS